MVFRFKRFLWVQFKIILTSLLFLHACTESVEPIKIDDGSSSVADTISDREFSFLMKVKYHSPYLYACATSEGLWRIDLSGENVWDYLGLATPDSGISDLGVNDIIINNDQILAGYDSDVSSYGDNIFIFKSADNGNSWVASSAGHTAPSILILKNPIDPNVIISCDEKIFRSGDNGDNWQLVWESDIENKWTQIKWNPFEQNEVWCTGNFSSGYGDFLPAMIISTDMGNTFHDVEINGILDTLVQHGGVNCGITDIDLDIYNSGVAFIVVDSKLVKLVRNGNELRFDSYLINIPEIRRIESDLRFEDSYFLIDRATIYYSMNNFTELEPILELDNNEFFVSENLDVVGERLFCSTLKKVYSIDISGVR